VPEIFIPKNIKIGQPFFEWIDNVWDVFFGHGVIN